MNNSVSGDSRTTDLYACQDQKLAFTIAAADIDVDERVTIKAEDTNFGDGNFLLDASLSGNYTGTDELPHLNIAFTLREGVGKLTDPLTRVVSFYPDQHICTVASDNTVSWRLSCTQHLTPVPFQRSFYQRFGDMPFGTHDSPPYCHYIRMRGYFFLAHLCMCFLVTLLG